MGLGTTPFTNATVVAEIPERWTPLILRQMIAKAVAANHFADLSPWAKSGGDIFHIPDHFTNVFTIGSQATQGTEVTLQAPASVDVTLTIATHRYIAIQLGDLTLQQMAKDAELGYNIDNLYTSQFGKLLMDDLDVSLLNQYANVTTNAIGDTATVLSDAEVRQSIEKLDTAKFPLDECAWFIHPYVFWVQLGAIAKYYDRSQSGFTFVQNGNFGPGDRSRGLRGQLYDLPMYVTPNVVQAGLTTNNLLAHKNAFGFATQTPGGSMVRVQAENKMEFLSTVVVVDMIYGVKTLRENSAVLVKAAQTFIGS